MGRARDRLRGLQDPDDLAMAAHPPEDGHRKLTDIKARLRRSTCGARPATVSLHRTITQVRGSPETVRQEL